MLTHLISALQNAELQTNPYAHFYTQNVFPQDTYQDILSAFPPLEYMEPLSLAYANRYVFYLSPESLATLPLNLSLFWHKLHADLGSQEVKNVLFEKFKPDLIKRFGNLLPALKIVPCLELYHDFTHYSIGPHTDHPIKVINLLFYLPSDESQSHLGTSIYHPLDKSFTCEGYTHRDFKNFEKISTAPFLPNSLFCFCKSNTSFHGVEPISDPNISRRILNLCFKWSYK